MGGGLFYRPEGGHSCNLDYSSVTGLLSRNCSSVRSCRSFSLRLKLLTDNTAEFGSTRATAASRQPHASHRSMRPCQRSCAHAWGRFIIHGDRRSARRIRKCGTVSKPRCAGQTSPLPSLLYAKANFHAPSNQTESPCCSNSRWSAHHGGRVVDADGRHGALRGPGLLSRSPTVRVRSHAQTAP